MKTLCIDIGGTGIKAIVLDAAGAPVTERVRTETPRPADPEPVLAVVDHLARAQGDFDRVSVGFPGVVKDGVTRTAPNLAPSWGGFPLAAELERRTGKPARVANDAAIQGLGVVDGDGVEMVITLGTGLGSCIYVGGKFVPLELGHHPFEKGETYEERVSNAALKRIGKKRWNKRVRRIVAQLDATFNYKRLYLGGGNAKFVKKSGLPDDVTIVDNVAGLLGGIRLWS
ncbi:MAG TPA: ROK family protein [Byssovorax sp.]|jgi:polyphosphate glucokinase